MYRSFDIFVEVGVVRDMSLTLIMSALGTKKA